MLRNVYVHVEFFYSYHLKNLYCWRLYVISKSIIFTNNRTKKIFLSAINESNTRNYRSNFQTFSKTATSVKLIAYRKNMMTLVLFRTFKQLLEFKNQNQQWVPMQLTVENAKWGNLIKGRVMDEIFHLMTVRMFWKSLNLIRG